jgi:hypothetical protein
MRLAGLNTFFRMPTYVSSDRLVTSDKASRVIFADYVHPTMRVTTDINLRNLKQLEIVTGYLDRNGEGFKVPQGCELWLRDAAEGKRRECVPVRNWIDHAKRSVSFEPPSEENGHESRHVHEHDSMCKSVLF